MPTSQDFRNQDATDPQPAAYQEYEQTHEYSFDPGLVYLPVASATPQKPVRIRLHGGYGLRVTDWSASRKGGPPTIPQYRLDNDADSESLKPTDRILGASTTVHLPVMDTNKGAMDFRASGTIVMCQVLDTGPRVNGVDPLPSGRYPFAIPAVDTIMSPYLDGYTETESGGTASKQVAEYLNRNTDLTERSKPWPVTVYSQVFTHPESYME